MIIEVAVSGSMGGKESLCKYQSKSGPRIYKVIHRALPYERSQDK